MTKKTTLWTAALLLAASANAQIFNYSAVLNGPSEFPANASPGTGTATMAYNLGAQTLQVDVSFSGLTGTTTQAHIHATTAVAFTGTSSVAYTAGNLIGFPIGLASGTYSHLFDLTESTNYTGAFFVANGTTAAGASAGLLSAFNNGKAYLNIHSSTFGGGEIRGFLTPVPEPMTTSLATAGLLGVAAVIRHRELKG